MGNLSDIRNISSRDSIEVRDIRALVARHFDVDVGRVTDDAHLRNDLGADWLDRLELLILIEDQFADVEMSDDADQIEIVGDLIRHVQYALTRRRVSPSAARHDRPFFPSVTVSPGHAPDARHVACVPKPPAICAHISMVAKRTAQPPAPPLAGLKFGRGDLVFEQVALGDGALNQT